MLTFTFLGVGSAFARRNHQSNVLVEAWSEGPEKQESPDDTLLIDFGATGPIALFELSKKPGFSYLRRQEQLYYPAIRRLFITHQHADHIGGLEEMALMNKFVHCNRVTGKPFKPQIISSASILLNLWDNSLKGGLSAMPGRYALLQDYFFILALQHGDPENDRFQMLKQYDFELFPTDHLQIQRKFDWPSYGLYVNDQKSGLSAFFSGDSKFDYSAYATMLQASKIAFHDVQLYGENGAVHALLDDLRTMPSDVKAKTMLYHYDDSWDSGPFDFVNEEFAGFVVPQNRYVIFD